MVSLIIIIAFLAGALTMFTGLFYGLKWNMQIKAEEKPTVDLPKNPIAEIFESKKQTKAVNEMEEVIDEWLNGVKEEK